jgi:hypothetical protein
MRSIRAGAIAKQYLPFRPRRDALNWARRQTSIAFGSMQPIASIFPPTLKAAQSIAPAATANPGIRLFNASAPRSLLFDSKSLANRFSTTSKTYRNLPKNIVQTHDWR